MSLNTNKKERCDKAKEYLPVVDKLQQGCSLAVVIAGVSGVDNLDTGKGMLYRLHVTKDTFLYPTGSWGDYEYLIAGLLANYPLKRTLVQFEDLPSTCK